MGSGLGGRHCYAPCSNSEVRTPDLRTPYFATPTPFLLRILFRVPYPRTFSVLRYLRTPYSVRTTHFALT